MMEKLLEHGLGGPMSWLQVGQGYTWHTCSVEFSSKSDILADSPLAEVRRCTVLTFPLAAASHPKQMMWPHCSSWSEDKASSPSPSRQYGAWHMDWSVLCGMSSSLRMHSRKKICVLPTEMFGCLSKKFSVFSAMCSKLAREIRWQTPPMYAIPRRWRLFTSLLPSMMSKASSSMIPLHRDMFRWLSLGQHSLMISRVRLVSSQQPEMSR
mmetsp:Transcript_13769/g.31481  ORF Transcript_13769/g.31481 Transcript_13769/m.31481 type:complete len:210 (-) Transcript_13769:176-805(-)